MKLDKLKGISDISEEILIKSGISDISVIQEEGFNPILIYFGYYIGSIF